MQRFIYKLALSAIAAISFMLVMLTFVSYLDLPVVQFSHTSGECVRVIPESQQHSCKQLPTKYNSEWVQ